MPLILRKKNNEYTYCIKMSNRQTVLFAENKTKRSKKKNQQTNCLLKLYKLSNDVFLYRFRPGVVLNNRRRRIRRYRLCADRRILLSQNATRYDIIILAGILSTSPPWYFLPEYVFNKKKKQIIKYVPLIKCSKIIR